MGKKITSLDVSLQHKYERIEFKMVILFQYILLIDFYLFFTIL